MKWQAGIEVKKVIFHPESVYSLQQYLYRKDYSFNPVNSKHLVNFDKFFLYCGLPPLEGSYLLRHEDSEGV